MRLVVFVLSISVCQTLSAQVWQHFDSLPGYSNISIDTASNPSNTWQIGPPQKSFFDSAYSAPNGIVTDTVNTYSPNDTSVFYAYHTAYPGPPYWPALHFVFKIDADSLNDFGMLHASYDMGQTWFNMITTENWWINETGQNSGQPLTDSMPFTGTGTGWYTFESYMSSIAVDTIVFRFTFTTDSVETNQEGWMIDELILYSMISSVPENSEDEQLTLYPNPTTGLLTITGAAPGSAIAVLDIMGREVTPPALRATSPTSRGGQVGSLSIDLSGLPNGIYFARVGEQTKKVVLSR